MNLRVLKVAPLLFGSGMCALIYQTTWLREMRLVFGASTAASAAVLAIFMGGLGVGGVLLGRRADAKRRPLLFYANLELGIATSAALTPALVWLAQKAYAATGGSVVLGAALGTVVRLLLSTLVLCIPTVLMGGTLPAAARAVETDTDTRRRSLAVLYGMNTLGAVTGALLSTFVLLEIFGNRTTLWIACLCNALVAMVARSVARALPESSPVMDPAPETSPEPSTEPSTDLLPPPRFVLVAAAVVGFAFLLMELVWYRMLSSILGGSTFTFGLILAMALLGIGLGGMAYALWGERRPATVNGFALTCALEALCMVVPYALGDRVAYQAGLLRTLGALGFSGHVLAWCAVTTLVVLPAAFVSGIQFPILIALLGRGGDKVGSQVGLAYAWNTGGAILGSLAGGFGLLPLLSAPGAWRLAAGLLLALGVLALALGLSQQRERRGLQAVSLLAAVAAAAMLTAKGPTAAWRHSGIGVGRADLSRMSPNGIHDWANGRRRSIAWETEGVESSVALSSDTGKAFVLNGKPDGHSRNDGPTQVMSGLIAALLHPGPKSVLVVGLGTGSTAGWLGAVPGMERVDVVEIEPAILRVARECAPVNHDMMNNPRVHTLIGDAREVLTTTPRHYDIVVSEPANPHRAGIASMFTQDFYQSVVRRLAPGGLFAQWLQGYEVDGQTVRTTYATLLSVFPIVETWLTHDGDLLLIGAQAPIRYDVPALRARVAQEPFRSAMAATWRAVDLEGLLGHFIARASLYQQIARMEGDYINTDDHTPVEFGFARSVGRSGLFAYADMQRVARARGEDRPEVSGGAVDWGRVEDERISMVAAFGTAPQLQPHFTPEQQKRALAQARQLAGDLGGALAAWRAQPRGPINLVELLVLADALADAGSDEALPYIERLRGYQPAEADVVLARLHLRKANLGEAAAALSSAFRRYREDPWPLTRVMEEGLGLSREVAQRSPALAEGLFQVLREPFVLSLLNEKRKAALLEMAGRSDFNKHCVEVMEASEPWVPWQEVFLRRRLECYAKNGHWRAARAEEDLAAFLADEPTPFAQGLRRSGPNASP